MADTNTTIEMTKKYDWDPVTSDDNVVRISLGGKPMRYLMVEDAAMNLDRIEGVTPDYRKHVPDLRNMKVNSDDVIICGFAKSGTNWLWEIVQMLQNGKSEYHRQTKVSAMMEFTSVADLEAQPKPRVYNTHFSYKCLPTDAVKNKCKIIFIRRNPKDVLVSFLPFLKAYNFMDQQVGWTEFFDNYIKLDLDMALFNWFYYTKSWYEILKETPENIYSLSYEDLKKDTVQEISKLAKFLGVKKDITLFKNIAEKCSFQNLKAATKIKPGVIKSGRKTDHLFRKGVVGDWKNYFTVEQSERFDAVVKDRMTGVPLDYRYVE